MKVLEIKNNLVKIAYESSDNLALSGFVIIEDEKNPYVAQIMNLKADANNCYAIVKLLFTFDNEGILKSYNGTIPSLKSTVSSLPAKELLDIIPKENPITLGELAQQNFQLKIDKSLFENNLLVCSNNLENTILFINNGITQLDRKTVIFDFDGQFDWDKKITFGKDFKLPLNYDTINFIYDNELDDVDATSRAVIQDIFLEVQQYTKTLPEGFLPFENFFNVVDAQYKETKITQLVLLKNKLMKYKEMNVFAENLKDILNLSIEIEKNKNVVIDISDMPVALQKEIVTYTYKVMNSINEEIYSFVKVNNNNSDKKLLKMLLENTNVYTTIICPHEYKYLNELKETAQNLVLFAPLTLQHDFASYNTFLNKLNADEFIIYGAHTQNIPLIVALSNIDGESEEEEEIVEKSAQDYDSLEDFDSNNFEDDVTEAQTVEAEPEILEENQADDTQLISMDDNIEIVDNSDDFTSDEASQEEIPNILSDDYTEPVVELVDNSEDTADTLTFEEEPDTEESDIVESDIVEDEQPVNQEQMIDQVSKDIDRAFYEKLPETNDDEIDFEKLEETDELTEDDLNLIDNLADDEIQLAGDEPSEDFPEVVDEEEKAPILPIYDADDIEEKEAQNFEPGDRVSTAKYGEGVVEKMIKYGNKMLCSIEFPNIGRRLLDPAMTEITKL